MVAQDMEPQAVQAVIREGGIVRCRICQSAILLVYSERRGADARVSSQCGVDAAGRWCRTGLRFELSTPCQLRRLNGGHSDP